MDSYSYYVEDDGEEIVYNFTTTEATYSVYFRPNEYTKYLESYPHLLRAAYGFGFFQFPHTSGSKIRPDAKIQYTIDTIILDFFSTQDNNTVLLYHCDYSDGRQDSRSCKFKKWYSSSSARATIKKHEINIETKDGKGDITNHYIGYLSPYVNSEIDIAHQEFDDFSATLADENK